MEDDDDMDYDDPEEEEDSSSDDESGLNLVDYDPYAGIDFSSSGDEL